jgi:hypothetical protein
MNRQDGRRRYGREPIEQGHHAASRYIKDEQLNAIDRDLGMPGSEA